MYTAPDLLLDLKTTQENNCCRKTMAKYANSILLVLVEWLLIKPTEDEQKDILELLHHRRKKSSTIFCSLLSRVGWYEQLGEILPHWQMQSLTVLPMTPI